ncbi:MAG: glycosyltransferase family 4 protein [Muribaculaceae bacterium]|nr:glycosyltransferase family 4 protein [Muribaculaceae bacterium]
MKRILVISNLYPSKDAPFYGSFVKNFVDQLKDYVKGKDVEVKICVLSGRNDGKFKKLSKYLSFYLRLFYNLIFFNYSMIYVHLITHATLPIKIVSKFKKLNLVFNIHGEDLLVTTPLAKRLLDMARPVVENAHLVVVPSIYFKNITERVMPKLSKDRIIVSASGGVKSDFFVDESYIKDCERDNDVLNIGYVSRIDRGKGWETLIEAIDILNREGCNIKATIIGGGLEANGLRKKIKDNSLCNVDFVGPVGYDQLPDYYNKMDLFVFPTLLRESVGLVGLEAMAAGVPVVGSNIGGLTDYIMEGKNGFLFEPGNAKKLAEGVRRYLSMSKNQKIEMKMVARATAENYRSDRVAGKLFDYLFENVVK